jgi:hypothetical protein
MMLKPLWLEPDFQALQPLPNLKCFFGFYRDGPFEVSLVIDQNNFLSR